MNEMQFLTWVRGPGLNIAVGIFVLGTIWRLFEIYGLGRKQDIAPPRHRSGASGWHTILRRSVPGQGMLKASPIGFVAGYIFHIGLGVIVFAFAQHIDLIKDLIGFGWPALPSQIVDAASVITLAAMLVMLFDRINRPAKRFLSTFEDYFAWAITFLPVLTGYMAVKHLGPPYTTMLALHILSAEVLLVALPFTKLFHAVTVFASRWYNGAIAGRRGVPV
jgi:nitrate reductase gamma subunit